MKTFVIVCQSCQMCMISQNYVQSHALVSRQLFKLFFCIEKLFRFQDNRCSNLCLGLRVKNECRQTRTWWIRAVFLVAVIYAVVKVVANEVITDTASIVTSKFVRFTCYNTF